MSQIAVTMIRTQRAWYAHPGLIGQDEYNRLYKRDEVGFHLYEVDVEGNRTHKLDGEAYLRWFDLGGKPSPHFQVFDDSWHLLEHVGPLLTKVKAVLGENLGVDEFEKELFKLGVVDLTELEPTDPVMLEKFRVAVANYTPTKPRAPGI